MFMSSERNAEHLGLNGEELARVPFIRWHKRLSGMWVLMDELAHRSSSPLMPQVAGRGHGSGIVFLSLSKQKVTLYMMLLYNDNGIRYSSAGDEHEYVPLFSLLFPLQVYSFCLSFFIPSFSFGLWPLRVTASRLSDHEGVKGQLKTQLKRKF